MCQSLFCKAILYPALFAMSVVTFWGASSSYTMHLVKEGAEFRTILLKAYQERHGSGRTVVPTVTQLSSDPPMWRVSDFMSEGEMAYLKEAYSPTFTSCFPGASETLVWWLGRWASWGSIRVSRK
ncbi:hypothetical protein TrST_g10404 [Triparma strigata]|uniref:Uncharacterized protein n=1 Tax=Triparma strigata TaxID=1606541 RepID=A0A9W7C859_9STRA|nr:hypothetical protein TrST_g10404 [Triparma strigata]